MSKPLRFAILECDTPVDSVFARRGTYGEIFKKLISDAHSRTNSQLKYPVELKLTTWDVVNKQEYPDLKDVDALLLTGSSKPLSLSPPVSLFPQYHDLPY